MDRVTIGGAPVERLVAPPGDAHAPRFLTADIIPGRAMMLLQVTADVPRVGKVDLIASPPPDEAARRLSGFREDAFGNAAFAFGGAILAPFANRIRGRETAGEQSVETSILGKTVRLPANWGGKGPGAEIYAMHGLALERSVQALALSKDEREAVASGTIYAGNFEDRWPGSLNLQIVWRLSAHALTLAVTATNVGDEPSPVGLGWHPYFTIPSGRRSQARLRVPAESRVIVNNYDEVLPTGEVEPVAGTPYDFRAGEALDDLYLDDCFTDLAEAVVDIVDPLAGFGLRIASPSPEVRAFQIFAPPSKDFVVIEPQFNLADPFGAEWRGRPTGMVILRPGASTTYEARVELLSRPEALHG